MLNPTLRSAAWCLLLLLPALAPAQEEGPDTSSSGNGGSNTLVQSQGSASVELRGSSSSGTDNLNRSLPPGTVVSTGEDGKVVIELEPGIVIELEPNSQIVIGETIPGGAEDADGNPIPLVSITINSGTITVLTTEGGLATAALQVVTPRGVIVPVVAGQSVITVTGTDPASSTVTVASVAGSEMVTTTEGENLPVAEGLAVVLRPDGQYQTLPIVDLPNGAAIISIAQNAAQNVAGLNLNPGGPPPPPVPPPEPPLPPDPPAPTPTPTPAPTPTPVPTPSPSNTP